LETNLSVLIFTEEILSKYRHKTQNIKESLGGKSLYTLEQHAKERPQSGKTI
jgi:hypothetical protein